MRPYIEIEDSNGNRDHIHLTAEVERHAGNAWIDREALPLDAFDASTRRLYGLNRKRSNPMLAVLLALMAATLICAAVTTLAFFVAAITNGPVGLIVALIGFVALFATAYKFAER